MTNKPPAWWADALATVAYGIRRNTAKVDETTAWDMPGIKAAINRVSEAGTSPVDTARVVIQAADNPKCKTPGGISEPGPHWTGTTQADRKQRPRCPKHHVILLAGDCPKCAETTSSNRPENFAAVYHQAMQDARAERERIRQEAIEP